MASCLLHFHHSSIFQLLTPEYLMPGSMSSSNSYDAVVLGAGGTSPSPLVGPADSEQCLACRPPLSSPRRDCEQSS
jgi:hypothetical protein